MVLVAFAAFAAIVLSLSAGCGEAGSGEGDGAVELRVFAAASLTEAFTELGEQYMQMHQDVKVVFNFAGSQDLVAQIDQGAPADVLATADLQHVDAVEDLLEAPREFATNQLRIAVAPGNPLGITGLADLAGADLKVVLAAPEVPAGAYAQEALRKAGVTVEPVSLEDNVKGVVTKIALGEADAGIVYVTDVIAAGEDVTGVTIPPEHNVTAAYPIAMIKASEHREAAQGFIDLLLSAEGRRVLSAAGFSEPR